MENSILEMQGITKYIFDSYGKALKNTNVKILDDVNFTLKKGEVHVVVGENGAGKSTLMKVLGGIIPSDGGKITINGKETIIKNPRDAREKGIGFIHQELNLCQNIDVAHNIFLGREPKKNGLLNKKEMYRLSKELLNSLGFDVNPKTLLSDLSTAHQQIVEIAKALSFESKIMIMDEPTASLSKSEIDMLFNLIREMKEKGISVIYISHRFDELTEIGDRLTVLRDGKYIGTIPISEFDYNKVIGMMVGRPLGETYKISHKPGDETILELRDVKISDKTKPISIIVRRGEIVGLGGLVGSGRTELAKTAFGARKAFGGEVYYCGKKQNKMTPFRSIRKGMAYLSEDRKIEGLISNMSIGENITLPSLYTLFTKYIINRRVEKKTANSSIKELNIVCRSLNQLVSTLSGGNQQRVVFGKWLTSKPKLLILDEPTRGIDVNAKTEIYRIIDNIASKGVAVLMISSELPELIAMSDRIYVMKNGGITLEVNQKEMMTQEKILESSIG